MNYVLKRIAEHDMGTFGVMIDENDLPFACTLERPWAFNQPNVSCIPAGAYECHRSVHPQHGECFELMNVPGRSAILIHVGNVIADSEGCILIGLAFGPVKDSYGIISSTYSYQVFMQKLSGVDNFTLRIIDLCADNYINDEQKKPQTNFG